MFRKTSKTSINGRQVRTEISVSARVKIAIIGVLTLSFATLSAAPSFAAVPTITSVSPTSGSTAGGTAITITGTGFSGSAGVRLGGSMGPACRPLTVVSATSITCTTPSGTAGAADVKVSNSGTEFATLTGGFTYTAISAPTITAIAPTSGSTAGGTAITITGTGFVAGATVSVGGAACTGVTVVSASSITCTTPAGTVGAKNVVVTNADTGAATLTGAFTYSAGVSAPTITSVTPTSGSTAGGTAITITGTGFLTGAGVRVGAALRACTSVTVVSATSITCITPPGSAGAGDLTVTNTDTGAGLLAGAFTYTTSADVVPVVVTVAPMTPEIAPVIKFTSTQVTCSLGKYSQTPASVVYTLVVGEDAVSTHFSNTMIPTWLVPWAGKTIDFGNATSISATWDLQAAWKGKTVSCLTLAYANNATGSTSSSAVVPS